jgi:hypothetical protein
MEKDGRVLADRIKEDRTLELRRYLAKNMDAFGFEPIEMVRVHVIACSQCRASLAEIVLAQSFTPRPGWLREP